MFIPQTAKERQPGWLAFQDDVVFVIVEGTTPRIRTGHICSWPGSHGAAYEVDNVRLTVVWCDQLLNDLSDDGDDAHEKLFEIHDCRFFKADEAHVLQDPRKAVEWFAGVYSPEIAIKISVLLSKPDFGFEDEAREKGEALEQLEARSALRKSWWQRDGFPTVVPST